MQEQARPQKKRVGDGAIIVLFEHVKNCNKNCPVPNRSYQEIIDEDGKIRNNTDGFTVLEEALMRGER